MVLVRLSNGEIDVDDMDAAEFAELLEAAREADRPMKVRNALGQSVVVMPEHVVYFTDKVVDATTNGGHANRAGAHRLRPAEPAPPRP